MAVDGVEMGSRRACRSVRLGGVRAGVGEASRVMLGIDAKTRFDAMVSLQKERKVRRIVVLSRQQSQLEAKAQERPAARSVTWARDSQRVPLQLQKVSVSIR